MAIACVHTRASCGVEAPEVTVEVHLSNGLPAFNLVGLPEASVKEARERVRSALSAFWLLQSKSPTQALRIPNLSANLPSQGKSATAKDCYQQSLRLNAIIIS